MSTDIREQLTDALKSRYAVDRLIGSGGMATVYLARDLRHDRQVALKVLNPELGAVLGSERFLSEIKVTANLQHPNLLPLFDSGDADGLLFYVMPYVTGGSLRARLDREKQLPVEEAVRLAVAVANALDYAHRRGVIHRDLKPENILLHEGQPVVADFGIALAVQSAGTKRMTQTGLSLGTPGYMSPEQALGDTVIDSRTDIYALGAVLYEMLVGEPPFTGATAQAIVAKVIMEKPASLMRQRDVVPANVDAAVAVAIAKLPVDRFATAEDFGAALMNPAFRLDSNVDTPPFSRWKERFATPLAIISVVLLGATIAATAAVFNRSPNSRNDELQLDRQLTFDGDVVGTAISPDGLWLAYVTDECYEHDVIPCTRTLQVREVDGTQSVQIARWPRISDVLKWSKSGSQLMFTGSPDSTASTPSDVYFTGKLGGSLRRIPAQPSGFAFTPDGQHLALATGIPGRQFLVRYDASTLATIDSVSLPKGWSFSDLEYDPGGVSIAARAAAHEFDERIVLLTTEGKLLDSVGAAGVRNSIRWEPGGGGLLFFAASPGIADNLEHIPVVGGRLVRGETLIRLGQIPTGYQGSFDISAAGRVALVSAPTTHRLDILRADRGGTTWELLTHRTSFLAGSSMSANGELVAVTATDNVGDNIYAFSLANGESRAVTAEPTEHQSPSWSPDDRRFAYTLFSRASSGIVMVAAAGGRERVIVPVPAEEFAWTANDSLTVFADRAFVTYDTMGIQHGRTTIPDSLAFAARSIHDLLGNAADGRIAYWSSRAGALIAADLRHHRFAILARSAVGLKPLSWALDGSVLATQLGTKTTGHAGEQHYTIVRISPSGGSVMHVAQLPVGCGEAVISRDARRIVCEMRISKPDVWLAERPGRGRVAR